MVARIYSPAKTAMQSGKAKTGNWVLEYEPSQPRKIDPLMGYSTSGDMRQQIRLKFETKEAAIAYAERKGIAFRIDEPKQTTPKRVAYSDNFSFTRRQPWTH